MNSEVFDDIMRKLNRVQEGIGSLSRTAEGYSKLAASVMVKGHELRTALQDIGNIAGTPFGCVYDPEVAYECALYRLDKISELVQRALIKEGDYSQRMSLLPKEAHDGCGA